VPIPIPSFKCCIYFDICILSKYTTQLNNKHKYLSVIACHFNSLSLQYRFVYSSRPAGQCPPVSNASRWPGPKWCICNRRSCVSKTSWHWCENTLRRSDGHIPVRLTPPGLRRYLQNRKHWSSIHVQSYITVVTFFFTTFYIWLFIAIRK